MFIERLTPPGTKNTTLNMLMLNVVQLIILAKLRISSLPAFPWTSESVNLMQSTFLLRFLRRIRGSEGKISHLCLHPPPFLDSALFLGAESGLKTSLIHLFLHPANIKPVRRPRSFSFHICLELNCSMDPAAHPIQSIFLSSLDYCSDLFGPCCFH